jgi:hypothetical protein
MFWVGLAVDLAHSFSGLQSREYEQSPRTVQLSSCLGCMHALYGDSDARQQLAFSPRLGVLAVLDHGSCFLLRSGGGRWNG